MSTIRTTIVDGHVYVPVPEDIPDGTQVEVRVLAVVEKIGLDESQWRTDRAAIKDWEQWLETVEPIDFGPASDFDREFEKRNVDAVREQMFGDQS